MPRGPGEVALTEDRWVQDDVCDHRTPERPWPGAGEGVAPHYSMGCRLKLILCKVLFILHLAWDSQATIGLYGE